MLEYEKDGDTFAQIHQAGQDTDLALLDRLTSDKANLEIRDLFGLTPLHLAVRVAAWREEEGKDTVKLLLDRGADASCGTYGGNSALQDAQQAYLPHIVKLLIAYGCHLMPTYHDQTELEPLYAEPVAKAVVQTLWKRGTQNIVDTKSYMEAYNSIYEIARSETPTVNLSSGNSQSIGCYGRVYKMVHTLVERHLKDLCALQYPEEGCIQIFSREMKRFQNTANQVGKLWRYADQHTTLREKDLGSLEAYTMLDRCRLLLKTHFVDKRAGLIEQVVTYLSQTNDGDFETQLLAILRDLRPSKDLIGIEAGFNDSVDIIRYYKTPWNQFVERAQIMTARQETMDLRRQSKNVTKRRVVRHLLKKDSRDDQEQSDFASQEIEEKSQYIAMLEDVAQIVFQAESRLQSLIGQNIDEVHLEVFRDQILQEHAATLLKLQPQNLENESLLGLDSIGTIYSSIQRQATKALPNNDENVNLEMDRE